MIEAKSTSKMASFLRMAFNIFWYLSIIAFILETAVLVFAIISPDRDFEEAYIQLPCRIEALDISVGDILSGETYQLDTQKRFLRSLNPEIHNYNLFETSTNLRFRTENRLSNSLYLLIQSVWFAVFIFVLFNLRKIFISLKSAYPFTIDNTRRLRYIGTAICLMYPVLWALLWLFDVMVFQNAFTFLERPVSIQYWSDSVIPIIFLGFVIMVISEIFRIGISTKHSHDELEKDLNLTV